MYVAMCVNVCAEFLRANVNFDRRRSGMPGDCSHLAGCSILTISVHSFESRSRKTKQRSLRSAPLSQRKCQKRRESRRKLRRFTCRARPLESLSISHQHRVQPGHVRKLVAENDSLLVHFSNLIRHIREESRSCKRSEAKHRQLLSNYRAS